MRFTRLIIIACVLFALIVPLQALAQSSYYGDVKGTVFSQAFRAPGAKVTLWSMDPVTHVQDAQIGSPTYTNDRGEFSFSYAPFKIGQQFQYMVRAEKGSDVALAWVYSLPAEGDIPVYVAPINMDLSVPSQTSEVTVTVWSTEGQVTKNSNLVPVPGVKLTLYTLDPATGNKTVLLENKVTDSAGQYVFNVPYGSYVVRAEKSGQYGEQSFAAYQQLTSTSLSTNLPVPSPTPTPAATAAPGATGTSTPGFEAFVALIALIGGALYLRRA
ncbi:MAG TPA: PGF-CTERM sorting domain-containing protein [Methanocella sp.]